MSQEHKRFVIQEHSKENVVHWDLMLEAESSLTTYRLELPPEKIAHKDCQATKIFDHDLKFLTYQGPVNKGLGNVQIVEAGTYCVLQKKTDYWQLKLEGKILKGHFWLRHINQDEWQFTPLPDNKPI